MRIARGCSGISSRLRLRRSKRAVYTRRPTAATRSSGPMLQPRQSLLERLRASTSGRTLPALVLGLLLTLACRANLETRLNEVRALQDVGQFNESVGQLREILAMNPDLPEGNYRLGLALVQIGEPSQAVWSLQKASESNEYAVVASLLLANSQFALKNYEGSMVSI